MNDRTTARSVASMTQNGVRTDVYMESREESLSDSSSPSSESKKQVFVTVNEAVNSPQSADGNPLMVETSDEETLVVEVVGSDEDGEDAIKVEKISPEAKAIFEQTEKFKNWSEELFKKFDLLAEQTDFIDDAKKDPALIAEAQKLSTEFVDYYEATMTGFQTKFKEDKSAIKACDQLASARYDINSIIRFFIKDAKETTAPHNESYVNNLSVFLNQCKDPESDLQKSLIGFDLIIKEGINNKKKLKELDKELQELKDKKEKAIEDKASEEAVKEIQQQINAKVLARHNLSNIIVVSSGAEAQYLIDFSKSMDEFLSYAKSFDPEYKQTLQADKKGVVAGLYNELQGFKTKFYEVQAEIARYLNPEIKDKDEVSAENKNKNALREVENQLNEIANRQPEKAGLVERVKNSIKENLYSVGVAPKIIADFAVFGYQHSDSLTFLMSFLNPGSREGYGYTYNPDKGESGGPAEVVTPVEFRERFTKPKTVAKAILESSLKLEQAGFSNFTSNYSEALNAIQKSLDDGKEIDKTALKQLFVDIYQKYLSSSSDGNAEDRKSKFAVIFTTHLFGSDVQRVMDKNTMSWFDAAMADEGKGLDYLWQIDEKKDDKKDDANTSASTNAPTAKT